MTGPEHYREAEKLEAEWANCRSEKADCPHCTMAIARAQVHATLALAAATAAQLDTLQHAAWYEVTK